MSGPDAIVPIVARPDPRLAGGVADGLLGDAQERASGRDGHAVDRSGFVEVSRSVQEAISRTRELIGRHGEALTSVPGVPLSAEYMSLCLDVSVSAAGRGAYIRSLYSDSIYRDADSIDFVRRTVSGGVEARCTSRTPSPRPGPMIVGRTVAIFLNYRGDEQRWTFVHGGAAVCQAVWRFERVWDAATSVEDLTGCAALDPLERRILLQLSRGVKDETAARALGVSSRTYRRHVTTLCDLLGASSRFEAGAKAAQVGWI